MISELQLSLVRLAWIRKVEYMDRWHQHNGTSNRHLHVDCVSEGIGVNWRANARLRQVASHPLATVVAALASDATIVHALFCALI